MYRLLVAATFSSLMLTAAVQAQTPPAGQQQQERRICRAMSEPGRLAGSRRVCLTRAQWDEQAERNRRISEEMIAGRDSCQARADGGTQISSGSGVGVQTSEAMARMSGC